MAIRYIREKAEDFAVDPERITCLGFSAGGHLCGMLGTLYDCPELADLETPEQLRPDELALCYPVTVSRGKPMKEALKISAAVMKPSGTGCRWIIWCGRICPVAYP